MKIRTNRGRGVRGFVGQFTNRENLSLAGGILLAPVVTGFVRSSIQLPAIGDAKTTNALYSLVIPGIGALLTNRFSPALAKGMIVAGIANAIQQFIPQGGTATTGRFLGEYLDPARRGMGAYIAPQRMGSFAGNSSVPAAFNAWAK